MNNVISPVHIEFGGIDVTTSPSRGAKWNVKWPNFPFDKFLEMISVVAQDRLSRTIDAARVVQGLIV